MKPISHKGFKHLNKGITVLGFSPILGTILMLIALFLLVFSAAFKTIPVLFVSSIYLPVYVYAVSKQLKSVKENRMDIFDNMLIQSKLIRYQDNTRILNQIVNDKS